MDIEYFPSGPGLQITGEQRILVVADIHMGIESDLRLHGIHLQSRGAERIARLMNLVHDISPDIILLLGDIKHRVPGTSWQEFRGTSCSLFRSEKTHPNKSDSGKSRSRNRRILTT